jgi:F0F1-type ATP synthase membrane subunit a
MNPRARGCLVLLGIVVVGVVFCGLLPFVILPGAGIGMALPVIQVPGEILAEDAILGMDLTNTFVATLLADVFILIFVFAVWRASKGWTQEVPGRLQGWAEFFLGGFYSFMKGIGGDRLRTAPFLWPLVATIFLLLLTGNWMGVLPGVETVGKFHCAHVGVNGYPGQRGAVAGTALLYVDTPLNAGIPQTEESEHACHHFSEGEFGRYSSEETPEQIRERLEAAEVAANDARIEFEAFVAGLPAEGERTEEQAAEYEEALHHFEAVEREVERQHVRLENAEEIPHLVDEIAVIDREIAAVQAAEETAGEAHGAEDAAVTEGEAVAEETAIPEGETAGDAAGVPEEETAEGQAAEDRETVLANLQEQRAAAVESLNMARTQVQYPTASIPLAQEDLDRGALPFIFHITPFVRTQASDLSLAFFLAILAMVAVQIYGVWAQGPAYFEKFVNISALGNLGKKPLGAIDFVVGVIEIISEIGKIVSLAFRLFGNIFAGAVALAAMTFLVIYLLEIIVGSVQALVFAVLTLVFAVQAMESHHGDDHEHAEEH